MHRIARLAATLILPLTLGACDGGAPAPDAASPAAPGRPAATKSGTPVPADAVAIVNGRVITTAMYGLYREAHAGQEQQGVKLNEQEMINELINLQLLAQAAVKAGIQNAPATARRLEFQRDSILAGAMIEHLLRRIHVSDSDVKREYQQRYGGRKRRVYRARNILVASREEAKRIIGQLRRGADFAQLARAKSIGPAASAGGALEWFKPEDVLKTFADAAAQLAKGEFSKTPVKTRYGWNVILLEDYREIPPPPLKDVEGRIRLELLKQHLDTEMDRLRAAAVITLRRTDGLK